MSAPYWQTDPRKLKGSEKHKWLRENRQIVLDYLAKYGKGTAMIRFGISRPDTFDRLIEDESERIPINTYQIQMATTTAREAIESARQAHMEIRGLAESYENFIESLADQLNKKFLIPLLKLAFTLDAKPILPDKKTLLVSDILDVPPLPRPKAKPRPKRLSQQVKQIYLEAHPFAGKEKGNDNKL